MNNMKKQLFAAIMATGLLAVSSVSSWGQTAVFTYDDGGAGGGLPNSGTYHPGDSFTFSIDLAFTPGGTISNLDGVSYWLQQNSPASPFIASVTLRDVSTSPFTDLQTPGLTYPQNLNPSNANDLGGAVPIGNSPLGAGSYPRRQHHGADLTHGAPVRDTTSCRKR